MKPRPFRRVQVVATAILIAGLAVASCQRYEQARISPLVVPVPGR